MEWTFAAGQGVDLRIDPKKVGFRLELRVSPVHRFGLFAAEWIPRNRKVIEYSGEWLTIDQADERAGYSDYLFQFDQDWVIDGGVDGSGAQFINHSCEPNLQVRHHGRHLNLMSVRPIDAGEELTIDYWRSWTDNSPQACYCGAKSCRGFMNRPYESIEMRPNSR
jgi:SET domain-containing protein